MGRGWITDEEDNVLVGSMEAAFASELLDVRGGGGGWCEEKCAKTSVGKANGRPRKMYCIAA